jgi:FkbM family methyltransferase
MLAMDHVEAPLLAKLPLPHGAHIIVAGAYKGDTVRFLLEHYPDAMITAYEPQEWALAQVPAHERVCKVPVALGTFDGETQVHSVGTDACSMIPPIEYSDNTLQEAIVRVFDAARVLKFYTTDPLSLLVLNVEGYEYTLLPYLLDNGIVPVRMLVQFHHYKTHEAAAFIGLKDLLAREYLDVREVGKGWWYYA